MKRFSFSLDRVLAVRRAQAAAEQSELERQRRQIENLNRAHQALGQQALEYSRALAAPGASHGPASLRQVERFADFARTEQARLTREAMAAARAMEDQQWRVRHAEQRCRLLEKLEQKERAAWESEMAKEAETLAADVFLAGWSRERRARR